LGSAADVGCVNRMPDSTTKEEKINELSYLSSEFFEQIQKNIKPIEKEF
jgi:hypothetical protein